MTQRILSNISLDWEDKFHQKSHKMVIGVDEVGRGCLAGPVVVAAVGFDQDHKPIQGINDSKKISQKNRELLSEQIFDHASWMSFGMADVDLINQLNILEATKYAMLQAISQIEPDVILIDGRDGLDWSESNVIPIIGGDRLCYSIAAASIVAKVVRDQIITDLDSLFPVYQWHQNKGYGTKTHLQAIREFGISPHHRTQFVRNILKSISADK